jgi:predicted amidohydrolase YtcJ
MGAQAMASHKFHIHETVGCLMFLSAGVQALLGHKSMAEMVRAQRMRYYWQQWLIVGGGG